MVNSDDDEQYLRYTGPQRLQKAINTLSGIVQGIAADGVVKPVEVESLKNWVNDHREFAHKHPFNELIPLIDSILADGVVDDEELADLRWLTERIASDRDYWDAATADMQELQGFLHGVLSDGRINKAELDALSAWTEARRHLRATWPYDELEAIIRSVLADGVIDDQEHEALLQFFGEFVESSGRRAIGAIERDTTVSGVCVYQPEIVTESKAFCFTGKSERGTKSHFQKVLEAVGAVYHAGLRNDTHYLIVGANGNKCWAFACYGRKIEQAVQRRRNGQKLLIVHEYDFWDTADRLTAR